MRLPGVGAGATAMLGIGSKNERARLEAVADIENTFHQQLRPRSVFAATLPLAEPTLIPRRRVVSLVRTLVEEAGGEIREHDANDTLDALQREPGLLEFGKPEPEHQLIALWVGGVGVAIILAPVRLKDIEGLASLFSPNDWEWIGRDVKRHKAHVAIYEFGFEGREQPAGPDAAFNRAAAVTSVAAALGEELGALAVCWHTASNALRPDGLASAREDIVKGRAPVDLWMRVYRTMANPGEHPGVITSGLNPFIGHEIEVTPSATDVLIAQNFVRWLAVDIVDRGRPIADGEAIRMDDETAARPERAEERGQPIWRFTFVDPWDV